MVETNKGHGRSSVMTALRRGVLSKVPPSVLEEMRPMVSPSHGTTTASSSNKSRRHNSHMVDISLRDKTDATAKRGFRVSVPKRLLIYTILVFFVFPLILGVIVGTRRILGLHLSEEQEQDLPSDFWQAESDGTKLDLQTVAKSGVGTTVLQEQQGEEPQIETGDTTTNNLSDAAAAQVTAESSEKQENPASEPIAKQDADTEETNNGDTQNPEEETTNENAEETTKEENEIKDEDTNESKDEKDASQQQEDESEDKAIPSDNEEKHPETKQDEKDNESPNEKEQGEATSENDKETTQHDAEKEQRKLLRGSI